MKAIFFISLMLCSALSYGQSIATDVYDTISLDCRFSNDVLEKTCVSNNFSIDISDKLPQKSKPFLAIKTNLLADVATVPNIGIEVPVGNRWSVGAEWIFSWWAFDNNKYCNQFLMATIQGRYWFHRPKQPDVLCGHAVGMYISGGYYDLQWKKNGYQGEVIPSMGFSYTYAHKVAKCFRMEYSLGLGVMNSNYRKYTANDQYDQFPWLSSGRLFWVGPTRAEVSFVWLISKRVRNEK